MFRTQESWPWSWSWSVRPAEPGDLPALSDFFAGLSEQTRYLRFFAGITIGPTLLRVLAGRDESVDALVATTDGRIVGHAMAARGTCGEHVPGAADIGVVVADAWQGRGVGSALVRALLAVSLARGTSALAMDVLPGNRRALAMIRSHWPAARIEHAADSLTVRVRLTPDWLERQERGLPAGRPVLLPG
jgi:GNAT superfamily N-acetyltransferase